MNIKLKYGKGYKECEIPDKNVLGILEMEHVNTHANP